MIEIGDVIDNRYNVLSHLGTGGMAVVFECTDLFTGKDVAVKILREELLDKKDMVDSFAKEVKSSISMSHPNIVEIYSDGTFNKRPYLVMEYLKNQTLSDKLDYFTKFSVREATEIILQLLDAVEYTHKHKIIHRDIKPQNIFYLPNGTIKLTDFGIATSDKEAGIDGKIIGSVHYLAPEVIQGKESSVQSDIYAVGITFFQLITGTLPFDGSTEKVAEAQIKAKFPKPSTINPLIPEGVDEIILKAVSKNPKGRFKTAAEFKTAIINFQEGKVEKKSFFSRLFN